MSSLPKIKRCEFYCSECQSNWLDGKTKSYGSSQKPPIKEGDECPVCRNAYKYHLRVAKKMIQEADPEINAEIDAEIERLK